jgi:RNase P/RNase MRP subunit p29
MIQVVIDRFEDNMAVCEKTDRTMINIPRSKLPVQSREGDVLTIEGDRIEIDPEATTAKKISIQKQTKDLWRKE